MKEQQMIESVKSGVTTQHSTAKQTLNNSHLDDDGDLFEADSVDEVELPRSPAKKRSPMKKKLPLPPHHRRHPPQRTTKTNGEFSRSRTALSTAQMLRADEVDRWRAMIHEICLKEITTRLSANSASAAGPQQLLQQQQQLLEQKLALNELAGNLRREMLDRASREELYTAIHAETAMIEKRLYVSA